MTSYRVSRDAELDLRSIFLTGMELFGLRQADRYRDALKRQFDLLAQFPDMARPREDWPESVRAFPHGSHVILYEKDEQDIMILRIRHSREDWLNDPLGEPDETWGNAL